MENSRGTSLRKLVCPSHMDSLVEREDNFCTFQRSTSAGQIRPFTYIAVIDREGR
jgi:hypothetical protein